MPIETTQGGTMVTGNAINYFQLIIVKQSIDLHLKTNGGMRMSRVATPARLKEIVSSYTGVKYARSTKGMLQAQADVAAILASRTPDNVVPDGNQ